MRVLVSRKFAVLTVAMSVPLLCSFQLKAPPSYLQGLPFILLWSWAIVSTIAVPILIGLEIGACGFYLRRRNQGEAKVALPFHATALIVAIVAEMVFISARYGV